MSKHEVDELTFPNQNPNNSMFSGIVEEAAIVKGVTRDGGNVNLEISCSFTDELKIDQSVAHNGVCLTVVSLSGKETPQGSGSYVVTAIQETLDRSNLGELKPGMKVNLERSMLMNGRLDGHIVQGHVDCTALCTEITEVDGSTYFKFEYDVEPAMMAKGYTTVEKGSVTVNGVSLTVCESERNSFKVAIIPYTFEHTNFCDIKVGSKVNIEFDIIGKYLAKLMTISK